MAESERPPAPDDALETGADAGAVPAQEPAEPAPAAESPTSPPPAPYELPTARRVVGSGLALAFASTGDLRKASIYVGLLTLGAFGPATVALLLLLAKLGDSAGDVLVDLLFGIAPSVPPEVASTLLIVLFEILAGLLIFVSISIDAQVIGIALLGARAGGRPMRLWEAIVRARQVFWRMAGSGALVGVVTFFVQSLIVAAFGGFSQSDEAASVFGTIVTTVIVAPFAYIATGIVLGDVGAMEAISRSYRLYKARRMLAVVVVLFPLVASAIQLFAFSAGLDLAVRAAEVLDVSLARGALAFVTAVVLVLASVVAYGSLTFTIAAVVAAPQVAGFLGLTFYSAGLDRARSDAPRPPSGFHYVSRPMIVAIVALSTVVALQIPAVNEMKPPPGPVSAAPTPQRTPRPTRPPAPTPSPTPVPTPRPPDRTFIPAGTPPPAGSGALRLLGEIASGVSPAIRIDGAPDVVEDEAGDVPPADDILIGSPGLDLLQGEVAILPVVPDWLLDFFDCANPGVTCPLPGPGMQDPEPFRDGALLFVHRVNVGIPEDVPRTYVVATRAETEPILDSAQGPAILAGASRFLFVTTGSEPSVTWWQAAGGGLGPRHPRARAFITASEVFVLFPLRDFFTDVEGWDLAVFAGVLDPGAKDAQGDALRPFSNRPLRHLDPPPTIEFSGEG